MGSMDAVHPYLIWWAILFAMAHYIRYEPTKWAAVVNVDTSDEAVTVEHIGEAALDVLPELIHRRAGVHVVFVHEDGTIDSETWRP